MTFQDTDVVTPEGLAELETHLRRFPKADNPDELWPPNEAMLNRLRQGARTEVDLRFYEHELIEASVLDDSSEFADPVRENERRRDAHMWTLGWQDIRSVPGYEVLIYHADVILTYPEEFSSKAREITVPLEIGE